jgi:hypothetical protein
MNFLFFGGWLFASLSLIVGAVLIGVAILESFDPEGRKFIPGRVHDPMLMVCLICAAVAVVLQFICGAYALYKGWLW